VREFADHPDHPDHPDHLDRIGRPPARPGPGGVLEPDDDPWSPRARAAGWRRGVAWVLAVVMGMGVVAMAVTAVHRAGSSPSRPEPQPAVGSGTPTAVADPTTYAPAARAG
jgi:hypothetical protein